MNAEHLIFQTDGTRYDLVLVDAPYGGVIVVWESPGYLWRWDEGDRMKPLNKDSNPHDAQNIFNFLEGRV